MPPSLLSDSGNTCSHTSWAVGELRSSDHTRLGLSCLGLEEGGEQGKETEAKKARPHTSSPAPVFSLYIWCVLVGCHLTKGFC